MFAARNGGRRALRRQDLRARRDSQPDRRLRRQARRAARGGGQCGAQSPRNFEGALFQLQRQSILRVIMRQLLPAKAWTIATLLAAAAGALAASPAMAGAYSCRVPRAILCEGCAKQIAITLLGDGSCRISFAPPAGADAPSVAPLPGELNFDVEVAPAPGPKAGASPRSAGVS